MNQEELLKKLELYAQEIDASINLHEEIEQKPQNRTTQQEKNYITKEILKSSYKLQQTIKELEKIQEI